MGISRLVGICVVTAMIGHPVNDRSLDRKRTQNGKQVLQPRLGLEASVRKQPVKPEGDPKSGKDIEAKEKNQVQ